MNIVSRLKILVKRYRCCNCRKRLKISEIAAMGPETLVWCDECSGAAKVYADLWLKTKLEKLRNKWMIEDV